MKTNKLYKSLRIIALTLAIISMIFTIFYKVGHCAESYFPFASDIPLSVNPDIGCSYLSDAVVSDLVSDIENGVYPTGTYPYHEHGFDSINLILFREYNSNENKIQVYAFSDGYLADFTFPSDFNSNSTLCNFRSLNNYLLRIEYDLDDNSITYITSSSGNTYLVFYALGNGLCWVENLSVGMIPIYAIKQKFNITNYPIYLRDGELSYSGVVRFQDSNPSGGGGEHSKGGLISDIADSIDQIEDSSELPEVDVTPPTDTSFIPSWLQKILNGIGVLTQSAQGTGLSIMDLIDKIRSDISEVKQDIDDIKNTDSNDVVSALQSSYLLQGYSDAKTDIDSFWALFNVAPNAHAPTWTIPLNGTLLAHGNFNQIIIDFSFYDSIKNTVTPILIALLSIGCALNIIRSIPDILRGGSGDESGGGVA